MRPWSGRRLHPAFNDPIPPQQLCEGPYMGWLYMPSLDGFNIRELAVGFEAVLGRADVNRD